MRVKVINQNLDLIYKCTLLQCAFLCLEITGAPHHHHNPLGLIWKRLALEISYEAVNEIEARQTNSLTNVMVVE